MQIVYPCGCKAVIYSSTSQFEHGGDIHPVTYVHLCSDHLTQFRLSNRDFYKNIGIGV